LVWLTGLEISLLKQALGNYKDAQAFVSTAYFTTGVISIVLVIAFFLVNPFIDWAQLFNTNVSLQGDLSLLLPIIFAFFGIQLVVKLITSIYQADQNHSIQGKNFRYYVEDGYSNAINPFISRIDVDGFDNLLNIYAYK
jgi:hypothetical protein